VLADRLENAGLIRREPADTDGRGLYAVLTAEGNTLLRRSWPVYSRALREAFVSAISTEEAALIAAALGRVNEPRASMQRPHANPRRRRSNRG
jgi:DNA-binding MarR family transcriptional regulator